MAIVTKSGSGRRSRTTRLAAKAAGSAPAQFNAIFLPYLPTLAAVLKADIADRACVGHRTAVMAVLDGLRITGSTDKLVEALLDSLNLRDQTQLVLAARMYHSASDSTLHDSERVAVATIQTIVRANPAARSRLMEACFGVREVGQEREEGAVLGSLTTNGGGNGLGGLPGSASPPESKYGGRDVPKT